MSRFLMVGRPTDYTPELANEISDRLASGESLRTICSSEAMPDESTVRRWRHAHPEFRAMYAHAREESADVWAERAVRVALQSDPVTANSARLKFDAMKWFAAKLGPKIYSDRVQHTGGDEQPLFPAVTVLFGREPPVVEDNASAPVTISFEPGAGN